MIIMTVILRQYLPNNNDDQILHRYEFDLFTQGPAKCHKTHPRNKYGVCRGSKRKTTLPVERFHVHTIFALKTRLLRARVD